MNNNRIKLQSLLEDILGSRNVYYQPPPTIQMKYPAIVYSRADIKNTHANDLVYAQNHAYNICVIDKNPDSKIVEKISELPQCSFNKHYEADNLNHDVFKLYY